MSVSRFEFEKGTSSKFWAIERHARTLTVIFGRIGSIGRKKAKSFPNEAKAAHEWARLIAEKLRSGYREVTGERHEKATRTSSTLARAIDRDPVGRSPAPNRPLDKAVLAQLPDPRRCKHKNPGRELDRVVAKHPWFRFGFRAGDRRISFDYAADGSGTRPGGDLLVCRIGGSAGPAGDAPPMTITKLLRQLDGRAPDLTTLWVSRDKRAPSPRSFGDLVAATLVDLLGAKAAPPEQDDAVHLAQRAFGSDLELHMFVGLKRSRSVILSSGGQGTVNVHYRGRRPTEYLSLADALAAIGRQSGTSLDPAGTTFERFSSDNRRLGYGPWVDTPTLRRLLVAAIAEVAARNTPRARPANGS
jgi:predicted DNA-binding WGR domain protein